MFRTEQDYIDYITSIRWPHGFECPGYNNLTNMWYGHKIQKFIVKNGDKEVFPNVYRISSLLKR